MNVDSSAYENHKIGHYRFNVLSVAFALSMAPLNNKEDNLEVQYIDRNIDERNYLARDSHMNDVVRALESVRNAGIRLFLTYSKSQ